MNFILSKKDHPSIQTGTIQSIMQVTIINQIRNRTWW